MLTVVNAKVEGDKKEKGQPNGTITLNGRVVLKENGFPRDMKPVAVDVSLLANNKITVAMVGAPETSVFVTIRPQ